MLIKYLGGLLWDGISALANALACCCSGGVCCGLVASPATLYATLESTCLFLDGLVVELTTTGPAGDNIEYTGSIDIGDPNCFASTWGLECNGSETCDGWLLNISGLLGCQINVSDISPDSCSCDPFELVFTATIVDAGSCTCCTVGDTVTIRVTV